ncbi:MAG: iron-containing redox enzyme family protein [Gammaproteobacteria bacterium]
MSATAIGYARRRLLANEFASADLPQVRFEPRFAQPDGDDGTAHTAPENFYFLLHHDESAAVYQPAFALVTKILRSVEQRGLRNVPALLRLFRYSPEVLRKRIRALRGTVDGCPGSTASDRSHVLREFAPTALLDGCWLQHIANAATAHGEPYARLSRFYAAKLGGGEPTLSSGFLYGELLRSSGIILPAVGSWAFITHARISEQAFATPVFQLALSFFPRRFLPEIIGYTLGHFAGVSAIDRWVSLSFAPGETAGRWRGRRESAVEEQAPLEAICRIVCDYLASLPEALRQRHWRRLWNGVVVQHLIEQPHRTLLQKRFTSEGNASLHGQVLAIFQAKRAFARGHHRGAELFGKSLAEWIEGDLNAFLSAFVQSPYLKVGDPDQSLFFHTLLSPDGPMYQVFTGEEIATLKKWVHGLKGASPEPPVLPTAGNGQPPTVDTNFGADLHWPRTCRDRLTQMQSGKQLFHRLVNVDVYPQIRSQAWAFVHQWLRHTEKVLRHAPEGDLLRPFPYSHSAFEARTAAIYSDAVFRYRPFVPPPRLDKQEYHWLLEQVAPFTLVDGCWLQNIALAGCANGDVRAKLFQIYDDEIGNGNPTRNHANIFRELLRMQGMRPPAIDSPVDLDWPGVQEGNFEIPNYLLAIAQFSRSFFPEILGLNLAIELSGLGGFYRTLTDELRYWDIDPRFFVLHQVVDNLASGHARLAFDAIALYLDHMLASSGEEEMQRGWRRIWTGYGALTVVSRRTWRHIAWAYVRRFGLRRALYLWQRSRQAAAA